MVMYYCCVCNNNSYASSKEKEVTFHRYPSDTNRRKLWSEILGFAIDETLPKPAHICSNHFRDCDFQYRSNGKRFLIPQAKPVRPNSEEENILQSSRFRRQNRNPNSTKRKMDDRSSRTMAKFCQVRSDQFCKKLEDCGVHFENNDLISTGLKRIFHIVNKDGHLLQAIKVYRALSGFNNKTLYTHPEDSEDMLKYVVETFLQPQYVYLVIVRSNPAKQYDAALEEIGNKLKKALELHDKKKVILITGRNDDLVRQIQCSEDVLHTTEGSVRFSDLTKECQKKLRMRRTVLFQGKKMSLEELFGPETGEDYEATLHGDLLERLVRGEPINVGSELLRLEEPPESCYIGRILQKKGKEMTEVDVLCEGEKVMLIMGGAGLGKSTLLAKLAATIKKENPHLWVVLLHMRDCIATLKDCLRDGKGISLEELIGFGEATLFDKIVFQRRGSVVLMLDGVDEAFPDDGGLLILRLLSKWRDAQYVSRVILTVPPPCAEQLDNIIQIIQRGILTISGVDEAFSFASFTLQPFRRNDLIEFLVTRWTHRLGLREENREKCEVYATELLKQVSSSDLDNHIVGTALGAKVLAELYERSDHNDEFAEWEGCREFLNVDREKPKLSQKQVIRLFQRFVEKTRKVFLDRANPSGSTLASRMFDRMYEECLASHRTLAVDEIVDVNQQRLFSGSRKIDENLEVVMLEIGFVHKKVNNKLCFAYKKLNEYFFAESLLKELQCDNGNREFQKYFQEVVLSEDKFLGVRAFLNGFLKGNVDFLPHNSLQTHWLFSSLVRELAKEGCEALLQLVIKYMNCQTDVNIKDNWGRTALHYAAERGHLDTIKFLMGQGADVNIRNDYSVTALHYATLEGYLDTVKFLVGQGARVNIISKNNGTPLHCAAVVGHLDTVRFLMGQGADVNIKNNCNATALHYATAEGYLDTVKFLVEQGADMNIKSDSNRAALHYAAEKGHLDTVKFLVEEGADMNIKGDNEWTALYFAAMGGHLDTVKFLIEGGAHVHIIDSFNRTALHYASEKGHPDIVRFLLDHIS